MSNGQAAAVGSQPVGMTSGGARIPEKAGTRAQPTTAQAHQCQRSLHTKALIEIPPEAMTDDLGITEGPPGPGSPADGVPGGERGEESSGPPPGEEGDYPDPGLLSFLDDLCAQDKYFLIKVDVVLHPRFLAELLSPDPELDLLALAEELEKEEGLSILQVVVNLWEREGGYLVEGDTASRKELSSKAKPTCSTFRPSEPHSGKNGASSLRGAKAGQRHSLLTALPVASGSLVLSVA
ncbi:Nut Family Member 2E [Manis pentadactyla]|nr:Nut Family Member 2E [Manis pentadactyla]